MEPGHTVAAVIDHSLRGCLRTPDRSICFGLLQEASAIGVSFLCKWFTSAICLTFHVLSLQNKPCAFL